MTTAGIIIAIILLAIAAFLAYAATRPDTFRVERSMLIMAPPEKIYALVIDLHRWTVWSPYEKKDPAMTRGFSGSEQGLGAVYEWEGNNNVGKGRMEIIKATPPSRIAIKLDFIKPFEGHNVATFTFVPSGDATAVTWAMDGPSKFITKVMGLVFNMDKMIGTDFAVGLANLKAASEG